MTKNNFFRNSAWQVLAAVGFVSSALGAPALGANIQKRAYAAQARVKRGPQIQNDEYYIAAAKRVDRAKRSPKVRKNRQYRDAVLNAYPGHIEDKLRLAS